MLPLHVLYQDTAAIVEPSSLTTEVEGEQNRDSGYQRRSEGGENRCSPITEVKGERAKVQVTDTEVAEMRTEIVDHRSERGTRPRFRLPTP
jgi:hypothetical protein